jgi:hypothetical protein
MRKALIPAVAVVVVLAGCGGTASTPPTTPATAAATSDATACGAFTQATTAGAPGGQDTMVWLLSQDHQATPALKAALFRFANAWGDPADVAGIGRARRAVRRLCQRDGF